MRERLRRPTSSERQLLAKARAASDHARAVEGEEGLGSSRTFDAWEVAADAWEDVGKTDLREEVRSLRAGYEQFKDVRRRYDMYEEARRRFDPRRYERGGGYSPEEVQQIERMGGRRPTDNEMGRLEIFEFLVHPPERYFAYYDDGFRYIQTWMGGVLGTIISKGREHRPMGGRVVSIRARAINGYTYVGSCNLSSGTYCKLRRSKPWREVFR